MIEEVVPGCERVIAVTPESPRALPARQLAADIEPYCNNVSFSDTIEKAVRQSISNAGTDDVICAFGSLYYIGRVRELFIGL
jgi:dihydrofolate synthase/folylpolyglutamate synthase